VENEAAYKARYTKYTRTHHIFIAVTTVSKLKKLKYRILPTHALSAPRTTGAIGQNELMNYNHRLYIC